MCPVPSMSVATSEITALWQDGNAHIITLVLLLYLIYIRTVVKSNDIGA